MLTAIIALAATGLWLALVTQIGVIFIQGAFPPRGRMVDVTGARLHVVELGPRDAAEPPVVMLHGASSNLRAMQPLGERIAKTRRVILIDRPGHGWSTRERAEDSTPAIQGRMIAEALARLGIIRATVVAHSWAGALALRIALDHPERVAGLVLLAPVAYPWRGGAGRYNDVISTPLIGPLLAHTITLPLGYLVTPSGARGVFAPQPMPDDFVRDSETLLLLRPREFIANARDLVTAEGRHGRAGAALCGDHGAAVDHCGRRRRNGHDPHPFAAACRHGAERQAHRAAGCRPHGAIRGARSRGVRDRGDGRPDGPTGSNSGQDCARESVIR
ncbi:pimeloyl-ACP methyl ester carboxylesterase [Bradyrhizobium sp. USDA 4452]